MGRVRGGGVAETSADRQAYCMNGGKVVKVCHDSNTMMA